MSPIRDSRLINLRDSIPGPGEWSEFTGPRGFQMVGVCYPNGYGLIFQVENLTGAGGSYCGPGTVEARLIKCGGDDVVADLMWPPGKPLPLTGGTVAGGIGFPYQDAEACQELARRVRGLPARDKTERF